MITDEGRGPHRRWMLVSLALALACVSVLLQWQVTGTGETELGAYSDEPAHYVTGLMLRDYVVAGNWQAPLGFAQDFYVRYPKVALGNWPPGFYLLQLPWLLLVGDSPRAVLLLMSLLAAATATVLAAAARRVVPLEVAVSVGLLWLCRPLALALGGSVMTEVPLSLAMAVLLGTWPALATHPRMRTGVALGIVTGWALLVKSSASAMLAVPLLGGFLGRHRERRRAALVVIALALAIGGPWAIVFREQARAGWVQPSPSLAFTRTAVPFYTIGLASALGWTVSALLACWGWSVWVRRGAVDVFEAACLAATMPMLVLLLVVPAGFEVRHVLPVTVPAIALAGIGAAQCLRRITRPVWRGAAGAALLILALAEAWLARPHREVRGYAEPVRELLAPCRDGCHVLVVSDAEGEGAIVAEAARYRAVAPMVVLRGSKVLSSSDWAGRDFRPLVKSAAAGAQLLKRRHVEYVLIDDSPGTYADGTIARQFLLGPGLREVGRETVRRDIRHPSWHRTQAGVLVAYQVAQ